MNIILKINKLLLTIITLLFLTNSAYAAKNDCSVFKKFSKDFFACKAGNIKDGFKNTAGKLKPKSPTNDGTKSLEKAEAKKLKAAEKNAKALEKAEAKKLKAAEKKAKALEKAEAKKLKAAEKKAKALEKAEAKANATSSKEALKKAKALEAAEAKKAKEIKKEQAAARAEARKKYKAEVKAYNQAKKPNLKNDKISIGISNSYSPWGKSATTRTRKKLVAKAEILNTHHNNADVTQTSLNPHAQVAKANDQHKMKSRTTNIQCHLHARDHNHEFKTKL